MSNETRKQYDEDFKRHIVELYDADKHEQSLQKHIICTQHQ
ncbi:MAG: hypothetical protein JG769_5 [Oscillospiraceae bacterium]|jgi:hypothetical protein|nr:hypothetical protein [Oscillospiraceae bacterium]